MSSRTIRSGFALFACGSAMLGLAGTARAALLTFDFTGQDAGASGSYETTSAIDPNLQFVTGLHFDTVYSGQNDPSDNAQIGLSDAGISGAYGFEVENGNTGQLTVAQSITDQHTFSFTIQPAPGYVMNLDGAAIDFSAIYSNGYWGPNNYPLFTSIGGFANGDQVANATLGENNGDTPQAVVYTLPATGYDGLTGPLTLRFAEAGGQYSRSSELSALSIASGSVDSAPAPEPSVLGISAVGVLGMLRRRARRA